MNSTEKGFTLIEIIIAVAVVTILSAIALPAYQDQVRNGKRAEAQSLLMAAATKQQRFHSDNMQYTNDLTDLGYAAAQQTDSGAYTISVTTNASNSTFTLTATPDTAQSNDNCGNLTLTNASAKGKSVSRPLNECWK